MHGTELNVAGGEWVVIALAALVLLLGAGRLPDAARKLGRAAGEYGRARDAALPRQAPPGRPAGAVGAAGPVGSEREKLEAMARSLGEDPEGMGDAELRRAISRRVDPGGAPGAA